MNTALLRDKKAIRFVILSLCAVYFTSYFTRLGYATVISEIVRSEGIVKSQAALATTACFITYGFGQLISGWMGDRISPKWMIFSGLLLSGVCNLLLPFRASVGIMTFLWGVNGFAQAMIWPPMMRMMTLYLDSRSMNRCVVSATMAANTATVVLYLASPVLIRLSGWRLVFYIGFALAVGVCLFWMAGMTRFEKIYGAVPIGGTARTAMNHDGPGDTGGVSMKRVLLGQGMLFILLAIVMQGTLRDGVTTWLPSYLAEVFRLDTGSSILSSVIIPLFGVVSISFFSFINQKFFRHELRCSSMLFGVGGALALAMALLFTASPVISALLAALLTACMHGVNLMLICTLPARFAYTGKVSLVSGVLNAFTYIGSALSAWGFAFIAQSAGWRATVFCWAGLCLVGLAACLAATARSRQLFAR